MRVAQAMVTGCVPVIVQVDGLRGFVGPWLRGSGLGPWLRGNWLRPWLRGT